MNIKFFIFKLVYSGVPNRIGEWGGEIGEGWNKRWGGGCWENWKFNSRGGVQEILFDMLK